MAQGRVETITFNGIRYRRYPDAETLAEQRYYVAGIGDRQNGATRLHQDIWRHHNGPIPAGHHIHHVDGDHDNNHVSNLVAITEEEHQAHHAEERHESGFYTRPEQLDLLERIRPLAAEWHGTPEGIEWHRQHGKDVWAKRPITKDAWEGRAPSDRTCQQCGKEYWSRAMQEGRFCSNACKSAWRRAAGFDNEARACAQCGESFQVNRYARTEYCSRSCASKPYADVLAERGRQMWANARPIELVCEWCGQSWTSRTNGNAPSRYCSDSHRALARYAAKRFDLVCEHCASPFVGKKPKGRFCGKTCAALHREAQKRAAS